MASAAITGCDAVDLENAGHQGVDPLVLLQQAREAHVHVALVGDQAHRAVGQALRHTHVLDRVLQASASSARPALSMPAAAGSGFFTSAWWHRP